MRYHFPVHHYLFLLVMLPIKSSFILLVPSSLCIFLSTLLHDILDLITIGGVIFVSLVQKNESGPGNFHVNFFSFSFSSEAIQSLFSAPPPRSSPSPCNLSVTAIPITNILSPNIYTPIYLIITTM